VPLAYTLKRKGNAARAPRGTATTGNRVATINGTAGNDTITGGLGFDRLQYSGSETLWARAYDSQTWSSWASQNMGTIA
jgi:Ca2+-binding RTX toxin-like protein